MCHVSKLKQEIRNRYKSISLNDALFLPSSSKSTLMMDLCPQPLVCLTTRLLTELLYYYSFYLVHTYSINMFKLKIHPFLYYYVLLLFNSR